MRAERLRTAWDVFFFQPTSTLPLCTFRVVYGICVIVTLLLLHQDWLQWYGPHGWVSDATMRVIEPGARIDLLRILPDTDATVQSFFWVALLASLSLSLGLFTRFSSVLSYLCLTSLHQRGLFINHGGDTFLRIAGFFLMFAPSGDRISLDALIRRHLGKLSRESLDKAPWAQRLIQIQLSIVYGMSFLWKLKGHMWLDGTALYYALSLQDLRRFPLPDWVQHPAIVKFGTWLTLALECSLSLFLWVRRFRYVVLLIGLIFHLSLEYIFNIPMFQWDILSAYLLFLDEADLSRIQASLTKQSERFTDQLRQTLQRRVSADKVKNRCLGIR